MMKRHIISILLAALSFAVSAQEKISNNLEIDKSIHDFGDVLIENGPVSCTFTVKNTGQTPAVIYNVVSSCGCTDVKWTREPLRPGETGKISVTYSNDEGAYPFDKTLTVYFSDVKKPYILKVRGIAHEKKKSLEELYSIRFGSLGLKETYIKCGNIEQKGMRSDAVNIANLSNQPINIEFAEDSLTYEAEKLNEETYEYEMVECTFELSAVTAELDIITGETVSISMNGYDFYFDVYETEL